MNFHQAEAVIEKNPHQTFSGDQQLEQTMRQLSTKCASSETNGEQLTVTGEKNIVFVIKHYDLLNLDE